ncbi:MAG: hypothetical protein WBQ31_13775 [Candidatus Acidiferrales bacterium]
MKRVRILLLSFAAISALLICVLLFLFLHGRHAVYNGQRVTRKTQWYGYGYGIPIPTGLASVYYAYQEPTGTWIREGPCVEYYPNGKRRIESYYLHGQLDVKESLFNENGIETLRFYWAQRKMVREVRCPCVDP